MDCAVQEALCCLRQDNSVIPCIQLSWILQNIRRQQKRRKGRRSHKEALSSWLLFHYWLPGGCLWLCGLLRGAAASVLSISGLGQKADTLLHKGKQMSHHPLCQLLYTNITIAEEMGE